MTYKLRLTTPVPNEDYLISYFAQNTWSGTCLVQGYQARKASSFMRMAILSKNMTTNGKAPKLALHHHLSQPFSSCTTFVTNTQNGILNCNEVNQCWMIPKPERAVNYHPSGTPQWCQAPAVLNQNGIAMNQFWLAGNDFTVRLESPVKLQSM